MTFYAAITNDELELICALEDSLYALAKTLGCSKDTVYKAYKRNSVLCGKYKLVKINIDEVIDNS